MFPFKDFNRMQSRAVPVILNSDGNVVVSAPTASGKTVLAEAAMVKELGKADKGKVLFIAPLRALTNEKESEWKHVLGSLGFKVYVVTGERELSPFEAKSADVIITTPEKWDSATRKYRQERYSFVKDVALVIIDEVHLLDSDSRGGALEAVISRMKRISSFMKQPLRIVALSATMPNIGDVAKWVGASEENTLTFDNSYRPVELDTSVIPYSPKDNEFLNKYIRLYKAYDLIKDELAAGHQALIFVSTRQDTYQATEKLCEIMRKNSAPYFLIPPEMRRLQEIKSRVSNPSLKKCISCGTAFHHAGLPSEDKTAVENAFREGCIKILVSTSTLAWGVNLPARVVVIRDTEMYDPIAGTKDISPIDLLQMLGRAGRPGYDTRGKGLVIVPYSRLGAYRDLLKSGKSIESVLKYNLAEHLNAEIAVGMVKNVIEAADWLKTTFLYVRSKTDPVTYGITDIDRMISTKIDYLVRNGFVNEDDGVLSATPLGVMTSDFYLRLETSLLFKECARRERLSTDEVLDIISRAAEFSDVATRPGESGSVKSLAGMDLGPGGIAKVRAILNGYINRDVPDELKSDAWAIKQNASRLLSAFARFCEEYSSPVLSRKVKMVSVQIDKGVTEEAVSLASVPGVGDRSLDILFKGGIGSLRDAAEKKPEDLIRMGIRGSLAIDIVETARKLPGISVDFSGISRNFAQGNRESELSLINSGGAGTIGVSVKAEGMTICEEKMYIGAGDNKKVPVRLPAGDGPVHIKVSVDYTDAMLPVDEWKTTLGAATDKAPNKTVDMEGVVNMRQNTYYVIAGEACVEYTGKTEDLYEGNAIVLIKPDSTVVVHGDSGVKPRNYMGQARISQFSFNPANNVRIVAENGEEKLSISFRQVALINTPFEDGNAKFSENGPGDKSKPKESVKSPASKRAGPAIKPELSGIDVDIEKALRALRTSLSKEMNSPPYTIFNDRTIYDLIAKKPKNKEELLGIYGIGQSRVDKFGDAILSALDPEKVP
ncbi:ATP-dependent helicase [Methanocella sp. CWC-04]|uniref:ATP-dependent helicase n=2 Tax=Methanooceanicella nereidis TaxID=2052831 RepID=A0AAP2W5S2_9EURY|nr:ATP-dependent helicase [Methanocella sp. CWC-04]